MLIPQPERDYEKCLDCGETVLIVGFWDDVLKKARAKMVRPDFSWPFEWRDARGRLYCADVPAINQAAHTWTCPSAPPPPPPAPEDDETKPYQRKRR